jgi:hypothetical protein
MRTNQVNTSLPRINEKESNLFQLIIAGSFNKVKTFWEFLKSFSGYRLSKDYQELFDHSDRRKDLHVIMQLEEAPYLLSYLDRKASTVRIQTTDGKMIEFPLLNVQVVEMLNGMTYVQGKSYDIFANPIYKERNEVEVITCTVADTEEECQKWN